MQTFLPFPSYDISAKVLDTVRLNKQIVECQQILNVLHGKTLRWQNHPAVIMWRGYEQSLCAYGFSMAVEWKARKGTNHKSIDAIADYYNGRNYGNPWWLGTHKLHLSHQSRLVHKGLIDVLKTRFGSTTKEQKKNYEAFASAHNFPTKWNQIRPACVHSICLLLDEEGYPEPTIKNHYLFPIDSCRSYIWPTKDREFKTNASGCWRRFFLNEDLPILF
jgi:hypothetical protein